MIERDGTEKKCRAYLEDLRWPNGVICPRCASRSTSRIDSRNQFDCNRCRYQFSVTAGTILHDSHLPLWKWFLAIYLVGESKKGINAKQLQRTLGVSYKTAWHLGNRIRSAMDEIAFRFNDRDNEYLLRDTLLRMIEGGTLPYAELVHG